MLVQYIILNSEAMASWTKGAIAAQAVHSSVAAISKYMDCSDTAEYIAHGNVASMATVILQSPTKIMFEDLKNALLSREIDFCTWTELPECVPTAIALRPYPKHCVAPMFTALKLYK